jgi:hypothetical protein
VPWEINSALFLAVVDKMNEEDGYPVPKVVTTDFPAPYTERQHYKDLKATWYDADPPHHYYTKEYFDQAEAEEVAKKVSKRTHYTLKLEYDA